MGKTGGNGEERENRKERGGVHVKMIKMEVGQYLILSLHVKRNLREWGSDKERERG
jgi:hypothetical protein